MIVMLKAETRRMRVSSLEFICQRLFQLLYHTVRGLCLAIATTVLYTGRIKGHYSHCPKSKVIDIWQGVFLSCQQYVVMVNEECHSQSLRWCCSFQCNQQQHLQNKVLTGNSKLALCKCWYPYFHSEMWNPCSCLFARASLGLPIVSTRKCSLWKSYW